MPSTGFPIQTSGWVNGNLQLGFDATNYTKTFAIGDASNYTPIDLNFNGLGLAGAVTAFTTSGADPNENTPTTNSSGISQSKKVNRYWTMNDSGTVFSSYDATFHFVSGDIIGGANTAIFKVKASFSSGSWTSTTSGTNTSTSSQSTGITSFSDYEVGEQDCSSYTIPSPTSNGPLCAGSTLNLSSSGGVSYSWAGPNRFYFYSTKSKRNKYY